jgi:MoaA/NifB/PqqE/SkfB family radical SAM enzyme
MKILTPPYHMWLKINKSRYLVDFSVDIVGHCNLNCRSCSHFSPLVKEEYLDIGEYERSCKKLSELTKRLKQVAFLGGEPLLHPNLLDFVIVARKYFDTSSPIKIFTNGTLLFKQKEIFWQTLRKYDVQLNITKYPIALDYSELEKCAKSNKIKVEYDTVGDRVFKHWVFDLEGKQDIEKTFKQCSLSSSCPIFRDGKVFPCFYCAFAYRFNNYFGDKLIITDKDYLELDKVKNIREIVDFLYKPVPFCKYCDISHIVYGQKWAPSKREISEWT